jgi:endonuclease G
MKMQIKRKCIYPKDIERITGEKIPVAEYAKDTKPAVSWTIPIGCNKG